MREPNFKIEQILPHDFIKPPLKMPFKIFWPLRILSGEIQFRLENHNWMRLIRSLILN